MTTSPTAPATVTVRPLAETDLAGADRILRLAFGTFLGMPQPELFGGRSDYIATRWRADPGAALAAVRDGELVGSNFVTHWGSIGFLGPLTVRPDVWDQGIAKALMGPTLALLDERGVRLAGLFTFAHSPKHTGLYERFGFWPQHLTAVLARPVSARATPPRWSALSEATDPTAMRAACREVTEAIYEGLDAGREIDAVAHQGLGETVLLEGDDRLEGFAVCHIGPGSEAGTGACYVKIAAVRPGPAAADAFSRLIDACEDLTTRRGASVLVAGANTARHEAYADLRRRGFRAQLQGLVMTRPNDPGYNRPGVWLIDDWR